MVGIDVLIVVNMVLTTVARLSETKGFLSVKINLLFWLTTSWTPSASSGGMILMDKGTMDYADQLIAESRNNVNFKADYTRKMPCPNRFPLGNREHWADPRRYEQKKNRKHQQCPSGEKGKVDMMVQEQGIWTTIECPICGYGDFWSVGDGDALF